MHLAIKHLATMHLADPCDLELLISSSEPLLSFQKAIQLIDNTPPRAMQCSPGPQERQAQASSALTDTGLTELTA